MRPIALAALVPVFCAVVFVNAQNPAPSTQDRVILDPASLTKPLADSWPTFAGDYTSRRFSSHGRPSP